MACYLVIATVCVYRCVSYSVSLTNSCMSGIEEVEILVIVVSINFPDSSEWLKENHCELFNVAVL